ncbi:MULTISPECIES: hypothetical protein [Prauserella salsuginis group]|uniref:Uncharacterized protein n=1 Tax=Prauserella salsuginis TaxID=387889 RepID=A0ABW6FW07_9PSEU|nr:MULTISPECIES: hypothetical protein [Prauserella salsuginis group]MCR3720162.1 hypothetical protein [Prauserella flava]MCR3734129.1 hypothetical protein [Prauserella salsuginis]
MKPPVSAVGEATATQPAHEAKNSPSTNGTAPTCAHSSTPKHANTASAPTASCFTESIRRDLAEKTDEHGQRVLTTHSRGLLDAVEQLEHLLDCLTGD